MLRIRPFFQEPSLRRPAFLFLGLFVAVAVGERALTIAIVGIRTQGGMEGFPVWLPKLGTLGETIVFYGLLLDFLKFVAIPTALIWLSYNYGRHTAASSRN